MGSLAISTRTLSKRYGDTYAVDGLDLNVRRGSIYGLLGRNGAGKTTTIRMLMGLTKPTSGSFRVLDMDWKQNRLAILQNSAYVSERKLLFASITGQQLLSFNRAFFPTWSDSLAKQIAERLNVPLNQTYNKLSRGDQTKLCLLMAIAQRSELLVIDEPTTGLDPLAQDELLLLLIEECAGGGRTVFLSSHYLGEIERFSDWVGILDHGKLLLETQTDDIRESYRRVTAIGNDLPVGGAANIISVADSGASREYVLKSESERFVAELRSHGAMILSVSPLDLREVFLHLVRKEEPCTPGNTGATPVAAS